MILILLEYGGIAIGTEKKPEGNKKEGLVEIHVIVHRRTEDITPENTSDEELEDAIKKIEAKKDELESIEYQLSLALGKRKPIQASSVSNGEGYPS